MVGLATRTVWAGGTPSARCPDPASALAVESFLLAEGRAVGLPRHEARFWASCAALSLDVEDAELSRFLAEVRSLLPRTGRWFPRLEAHRGRPAPLVFWLRPAPDPQPQVRLWCPAEPDPRRFPRCKGPDLGVLAALRRQAQQAGADDALLWTADGTVVETAHAGLLWWHGARLCHPDPSLSRLASVTSAQVLELARRDGIDAEPQRITIGQLAGAEVWAVNTLHGIRPVTGWTRDPAGPPVPAPVAAVDPDRLRRYRAGLRAAAEHVGDRTMTREP